MSFSSSTKNLWNSEFFILPVRDAGFVFLAEVVPALFVVVAISFCFSIQQQSIYKKVREKSEFKTGYALLK